MKKYKIIENNITYDIKEYDSGDKFWFLNEKLHREDGPAVEWANGNKCWYKNGKYHRKNGPSIECANGDKEYWYNGKRLNDIKSDEDLKRYIKLLYIS